MTMTRPMLYVHVPFCGSKCAYCAFTSHAPALMQRTWEVKGWLAALEAEADLRLGGQSLNFPTIFIGGGTPTFLTEAELEVLMSMLGRYISREAEQEITVEANPDSLTSAKAEILRSYGVNRISLGVQSLEGSLLRILGRRHTRADVRRVVNMLRERDFINISFDLMFGLPGQDMDIWQRTMTEAVGMGPEHLSLYGLSVEWGTPLACWLEGGAEAPGDKTDTGCLATWQLPDDDVQADMYVWAVDFLKKQGYERYEISNFSREGFHCRHNERTWRGEDYIGLGPSAVSTVRGARTTNSCELNAYIEGVEREASQAKNLEGDHVGNREAGDEGINVGGHEETTPMPVGCSGSAGFYTLERLTKEQQMSEYMILGLRMERGVEKRSFYQRFGVELEDVFGRVLERHTNARVLGEERGRVFLKPHYFFVANAVMRDFVLLS